MRRRKAATLQKISDLAAVVASAHATDGKGHYIRTLFERDITTTACYLNLFIALEEFLEGSFGHYLVGKMSTNRWKATRYARPIDLEHAQRMAIGRQRYMDWSTPDQVVAVAKMYLRDGTPFTAPLQGAHAHLLDMKTVRNSTAHVSITTQQALDTLYGRWTGTPTQGVTAYEMLLATDAAGQATFYDRSSNVVGSIVTQIADHS